MYKQKNSRYKLAKQMMKLLLILTLVTSGMMSVPTANAAASEGTDFAFIKPSSTPDFDGATPLIVKTLPKGGDVDTGLEWFRVPVSGDESYADVAAFDAKYSTTPAADKAEMNGTNESTPQAFYLEDGLSNQIGRNGEYWVKVTFKEEATGEEFPVIHSVDVNSLFTQSVVQRDGKDGQTGTELYAAESVRTTGTNEDYITNKVGLAFDMNGEILASTSNGQDSVKNTPQGTYATLAVQPRMLTPEYGIPASVDVPVNSTDLGTVSFTYEPNQQVGNSEVSFHIADNTSKPVQGANINIDGKNYLTDASGNSEAITLKAPGRYVFTVTGDGYIATSGVVYFTGEGQSVIEEAVLEASDPGVSTVYGYVVDENGFPLPGATVSTPINNYKVTTDDNGFYVLPGASDPTVMTDVKVSKDGFVSQQVSVVTASGVNAKQNFTLVKGANQGYTISGTVTDLSGTPVGGATVSAGGKGTTTDVHGDYTLGLLAPGEVTVEASKPGYTTSVETINVTQDMEYNIQLAKLQQTTVSFQVWDSEKEIPVEGATVAFNGQTYITNADGITEDASVSGYGEFPYTVSKDGYEDVTGFIYLDGGQEFVNESVYLRPIPTPVSDVDTTVSFVVRDDQGTEVEGAAVEFSGQTYTTNADGIAEITVTEDGWQSYSITKDGFAETSGEIYVADGEEFVFEYAYLQAQQ